MTNQDLERALEFDKNDKLSHFRDQFEIGDEIYLDGNSLGRLPKRTLEASQEVIKNQWGNRLIRSWNENWLALPERTSAKIAKLIGAREDEVFIGDNTSINFFKLAFAALKFNEGKHKIITDSLNFPTDIYVLEGLVKENFRKNHIEILESQDDISVSNQQIQDAINDDTALLTLSHVVFKSAYKYDMKTINAMAHAKNTLTLWDLSHAVGAVPIYLNDWDADLAVGCTYKYLNGGPGAPAFLYVRKDLQEKLSNPIWAWFSHEKPFDFALNFHPATDIKRFASGTPSILSMAAVESGVDILLEAGIENLRQKSVSQSSFLIELIEKYLIPLDFKIASPLEVENRGSHISIQHHEGYRINRVMIEPENKSVRSIIPDFRPPNNIRLGIAPLYNTYAELYETIRRIESIVLLKEHKRFGNDKLTVT